MNATKLSTTLQEWLNCVQTLGLVDGTRYFLGDDSFCSDENQDEDIEELEDFIKIEDDEYEKFYRYNHPDFMDYMNELETEMREYIDNPNSDADARTGRSFLDYEGSATMPITEKDFDFADSFDINELPF